MSTLPRPVGADVRAPARQQTAQDENGEPNEPFARRLREAEARLSRYKQCIDSLAKTVVDQDRVLKLLQGSSPHPGNANPSTTLATTSTVPQQQVASDMSLALSAKLQSTPRPVFLRPKSQPRAACSRPRSRSSDPEAACLDLWLPDSMHRHLDGCPADGMQHHRTGSAPGPLRQSPPDDSLTPPTRPAPAHDRYLHTTSGSYDGRPVRHHRRQNGAALDLVDLADVHDRVDRPSDLYTTPRPTRPPHRRRRFSRGQCRRGGASQAQPRSASPPFVDPLHGERSLALWLPAASWDAAPPGSCSDAHVLPSIDASSRSHHPSSHVSRQIASVQPHTFVSPSTYEPGSGVNDGDWWCLNSLPAPLLSTVWSASGDSLDGNHRASRELFSSCQERSAARPHGRWQAVLDMQRGGRAEALGDSGSAAHADALLAARGASSDERMTVVLSRSNDSRVAGGRSSPKQTPDATLWLSHPPRVHRSAEKGARAAPRLLASPASKDRRTAIDGGRSALLASLTAGAHDWVSLCSDMDSCAQGALSTAHKQRPLARGSDSSDRQVSMSGSARGGRGQAHDFVASSVGSTAAGGRPLHKPTRPPRSLLPCWTMPRCLPGSAESHAQRG